MLNLTLLEVINGVAVAVVDLKPGFMALASRNNVAGNSLPERVMEATRAES
jgi:hypothetical protein